MKRTAIFGPPGTGKTTKLLSIIDEELKNGVDPNHIAFVSFTNAAVKDAKLRVRREFGLKHKDLHWFRTIHSLCFTLCKLPGQRVVTPYELKVFAEVSRIAEYTGSSRHKGHGDIALEAHHLSRSAGISLKEAWMRCTNWIMSDYDVVEAFVEAYESWKENTGLIDFQDMIDNYLASPISPKIAVSIIDEVQDLNAQQWEVIGHTFKESERQYIAGDDDQAIYAWSGSRIDLMLDYPADKKIILDQSYRCPKKVHTVANMILKKIKHRQPKEWKPRSETGQYKAYGDYSFLPFFKYPDESWFVLARSNHALDNVRWYLKSVGAYFKDEDGLSINTRIAQKIMTLVALKNGEAVNADRLRKCVWDSSLDYSVIDLVHLPSKGKVTAKDAGLELDDVDPVLAFSRQLGSQDAIDYHQRALGARKDLLEPPLIELSTIHKAKGREADNVAVLLDQTGTIHDSFMLDPDNEHRNWYVAVTRAKKRLFTVMSSSIHGYDL